MYASIAYLGLVDDEEIDLVNAAFEVSALDYTDADVSTYMELITEISDRVSALGRGAVTAQDQAEVLARVIGHEYGFTGDQESYDASVNANLISVVDRRKGLPVSLAIIYIGVANRQGWRAEALDLPGHVVVSVGGYPPIIIDPFEQGMVVESNRLMMIMAQHLGRAELNPGRFFEPMSRREILSRLLENQASRAEREGDVLRAEEVYRRITVIAPHHGSGWTNLARLQMAGANFDGARESLSAKLEVSRDSMEREDVARALRRLSER